MSEKIFEIQNFRVKDQGTELLKNSSLEVQKGEVIAIIGQEGSGLNAIIKGLIGKLPTEGKLFYMGKRVTFNLFDLKKHKIEIVNQQPELFQDMSVSENLFLDVFWEKKLPFFYGNRRIDKIAALTKRKVVLSTDC